MIPASPISSDPLTIITDAVKRSKARMAGSVGSGPHYPAAGVGSSGPLSIEVTDDLGAAHADWRRIGDKGDNIFSTWAWATTWWDHYGRGRPLIVRGLDPYANDGVAEYRMLRGAEAYKFRFADAEGGTETVALPLRPLGSAAVAAARGALLTPGAPGRRAARLIAK